MSDNENVYLNKVSANKYELITKDAELMPRVYKLFVVDGMIILKPAYYKKYGTYENKQNYEKPQTETESNNDELKTSEIKVDYKPNNYNDNYKNYNSYNNYNKGQTYNNERYYNKYDQKPRTTLSTDYVVCEDQNQAKEFSQMLSQDIKEGKILGIKGFDRRYYIFKSEYYSKIKSLITGIAKASEKETTLEKIINATKEPEDAIKGVLEIMKEEGQLFERNKVYKLIE